MNDEAGQPTTAEDVSLDLPSQARTMGEAPAVITGEGQVMSYRQVDERSNRVAQLLRAEGLRPGDHIAILMENNLEYLEIAWAAQRSGLYYTAINSHLRQNEVQYILDDCGALAIFGTPTLAPAIEPLDLSRLRVRLCVGGDLAGFESYESSIESHPPTPIEDECEGREMLYSSGTTGRPKGVQKDLPLTPLGDMSATPVLIASRLALSGAGPDAVYLSPAPLYHSAPLVYSMSMLRLGAAVVVMERFDPTACLELIEKHHVTHAQFVPTMFTRLLGLPREERSRYDISSLKYVVHAAAPCPRGDQASDARVVGADHPRVLRRYRGRRLDVDHAPRSGSRIQALSVSPMEPAHIVGPDGAELPVGEEGIVYFEGGRPFEYHNNPDATGVHDERERVADPRRHRAPRCRRLPVPDRPVSRHDHLGGSQHLSARSRRTFSRAIHRLPTSRCSVFPTPRWANRSRPSWSSQLVSRRVRLSRRS